ncbi:MAG: hypothetical protein ACFE95_17095 [Candidatus Hodarchaeota archaeon]
MALEASGTPNRLNDGEFDFDGNGVVDTFLEIAQDAAEWFAMAQGDSGSSEGGWGYSSHNNQDGHTDNSNSGYAVLGLAAAEGFGCIIPDWVRTELNVWIDAIQNDVNGGSSYGPYGGAENELKTGNLIFEMAFYGDDPNTPRFQAAWDYVEQNWQSSDISVRWQGDIGIDDDMDGLTDGDPLGLVDDDGDGLVDEDPGLRYHQAMYCLMKGLGYSGIELIDLNGDGTPEHDWYIEFAEVLLASQNPDGSWPFCLWDNYSPPTLSIVWVLLTLEKFVPSPPVIYVNIDIKPGCGPNSINMGDNGLLPVAILGTVIFDVMTLNVETIMIGGVTVDSRGSPKQPKLAYSFEDVNGDGYMDLITFFDIQRLVQENMLHPDTVSLTIEGNLLDQYDGTPIFGSDSVRVVPP